MVVDAPRVCSTRNVELLSCLPLGAHEVADADADPNRINRRRRRVMIRRSATKVICPRRREGRRGAPLLALMKEQRALLLYLSVSDNVDGWDDSTDQLLHLCKDATD